MEVQGKQAVVAFGMIKSTVKLEQLEKVSKGQIKKEIQKSTFVSVQTADDMHEKKLNFKQEIDVRGMRGDEPYRPLLTLWTMPYRLVPLASVFCTGQGQAYFGS